VDEVDCAKSFTLDPPRQGRLIEAGVADVEVEQTLSAGFSCTRQESGGGNGCKPWPEPPGAARKKSKESLGMGCAKDVLMPATLNDRSRMLSEMVDVREANAIDARR
jgi:hypothetical protein